MKPLQLDRFTQERSSGDRNLVNEITQILSNAGHPDPHAWERKVSGFGQLCTSAPLLQRFLINRHWRVELGLQDRDTSAERFCLYDDGDDIDTWLKVFRDSVAETIVTLRL